MNSPLTQPNCWKVAAPDALVWEHLGEESVLFDRRSGQTHLLTLTAVECLDLLQEHAMNLDQLCEKLEVSSHTEFESQVREQLKHLLHTLNDLGLIVSLPE